MLTEGVWFEIFLSCPGDLLAIALSRFSPEKGGQGQPPVNVRGTGESHEIVKQIDSGLGIDARESLGSPSSPEALPNSSLPRDLVMGGLSRAGSQHYRPSTHLCTGPALPPCPTQRWGVYSLFKGWALFSALSALSIRPQLIKTNPNCYFSLVDVLADRIQNQERRLHTSSPLAPACGLLNQEL